MYEFLLSLLPGHEHTAHTGPSQLVI